jgi:hypothetical protein
MAKKLQIVNACRLTGEVMSVEDDRFTLKTVDKSQDGREFPEEHTVLMDDTSEIVKDDRVTVLGEIDGLAVRAKKVELTDDPKDVNLAKVVGPTHWRARHFERNPVTGQAPFTNLLLRLDDGDEEGNNRRFMRAVCFQDLAHKVRDLARGSIVKAIGRMRHRGYTDNRTGEEAVALEIIADPNYTAVLKKARVVDPFEADAPDPEIPPAAEFESDIPF